MIRGLSLLFVISCGEKDVSESILQKRISIEAKAYRRSITKHPEKIGDGSPLRKWTPNSVDPTPPTHLCRPSSVY